VSLIWTAPAALIGLALIALPIAVHLLVRHHVRTLPFPSLRFLRETQLAAFRRRSIQDAALLACRVAIVGVAVAALAGPVLQTSARDAGYANRTSRAIVISDAVPTDVIARNAEGAFASATVQRGTLADALPDAVRWLEAQPRSAREIVIVGALRRGTVVPGMLAGIPADIGIRFEQTATDGAADVTAPVLVRRGRVVRRVERAVRLNADATRVTDGAASPVAGDTSLSETVTIRSAPADAALADAALRAALDAGVPWRDANRRVVIVWDGGDNSGLGDAQVIRMPVPSPPASAADAVHAALTQIGQPDWVEPVTIPPAQLDAWSRRPGPPSSTAPIVDEGDRRWLWALVLVLLGVEWWMRQRHVPAAMIDRDQEARVA
jgi:hypothetical protein